jgi:hypothetical protein
MEAKAQTSMSAPAKIDCSELAGRIAWIGVKAAQQQSLGRHLGKRSYQ